MFNNVESFLLGYLNFWKKLYYADKGMTGEYIFHSDTVLQSSA